MILQLVSLEDWLRICVQCQYVVTQNQRKLKITKEVEESQEADRVKKCVAGFSSKLSSEGSILAVISVVSAKGSSI